MEHCFDCKRGYEVVWWSPQELWEKLTGWKENGLLCPDCFHKRADKQKMFIRFVVQES